MDDLPEKALSIRQPWVWAILNAGKRLENRPRRFHYRGPICLHASRTHNYSAYAIDSAEVKDLGDLRQLPPKRDDMQFGGIVGTANVVDCTDRSDDPWFFGPFALVLEDVKPVDFIAVKGSLGLFDWRKNVLVFEDYHGGSGRAKVGSGYYLVAPSGSGYRAAFSDNAKWVWDGGSFEDAEAAERSCIEHFLGASE